MAIPIPEFTESDKARFWAKVDVRGPDECWPWKGGVGTGGYGSFSKGKKYSLRANRVAMALDGRDPLDLLSCHTCDNPPCCNPAHLWAGSGLENAKDAVSKGRYRVGEMHGRHTKPECTARGERHWSATMPEKRQRGSINGNAILNESDVARIKVEPYWHGVGRALALEYGVSTTTISDIRAGKIWRHVD